MYDSRWRNEALDDARFCAEAQIYPNEPQQNLTFVDKGFRL
jgi:hypothetical protein